MDITEICTEIRNFFPPASQKLNKSFIHEGKYTISGQAIAPLDFIKPNQYFRIVGSELNEGVYQNNAEGLSELQDEEFEGAIWAMAVPRSFLALCEDITAWRAKNETIDSENMSPFTSESISGTYSYTKSTGGSSDSSGGSSAVTWQSMFAARLNAYRRISVL